MGSCPPPSSPIPHFHINYWVVVVVEVVVVGGVGVVVVIVVVVVVVNVVVEVIVKVGVVEVVVVIRRSSSRKSRSVSRTRSLLFKLSCCKTCFFLFYVSLILFYNCLSGCMK